MTARDDYLELAELAARGRHVAHADASDALDRIDQLTRLAQDYARDVEVMAGLNDLVRELTEHADTMRDLLRNVEPTLPSFDRPIALRIDEAIMAYDAFIKEA